MKQELSISKTGALPEENRFLNSIKGVKIADAAAIAIDQLFKRCTSKIGLRKENFPTKEEGLLLVQHLMTNYGTHTIPEIDLAFELAITDQLDLEQKEIICYENFSCLYLSKIINAYRVWAAKTYRQNVKQVPIESKVFRSIDWRQQTQELLDIFYTGLYKPRLTAQEIYDTLVEDSFLNALAYESFWDSASLKLRNDVQKEMISLSARLNREASESGVEEMSGTYSQHQALENKIIEYRNGSRDAEVKLLSKQMAVYHYFQYLKSVEITKIYEPNNANQAE